MPYHIFHTAEDFWKQVEIYKCKGYTWIEESHPQYIPYVTDKDMPVILNADNQNTIMWGIINGPNKERHFSDPKFVLLYYIYNDAGFG